MVNRLKAIAGWFSQDEDGATAIEYGLIAALIAVAIIGSLSALATTMNKQYNEVDLCLNDPTRAECR
ncbi:Flp family type IVb pilin [Parvularcula dongshanensis]|uniref:Pilus assembly protein Flp/PilA n=1 Tax=Parvularcula dongshanensis TaxID=1173995 RepID=A0A840I0W3_9PROT|nr:Flp family type IVb pilin [Parvularcula dongshanensis]MBB4657740.1 pilus assembly protein Flp/PilA [Parvularcula dongshanensis]